MAERDNVVDMLAERPGTQRITVGFDKLGDNITGFVAELSQLRETPHVSNTQLQPMPTYQPSQVAINFG